MVEIHLVESEKDISCRFWIGLTHQGLLSPGELSNLHHVSTIFQEAAQKGASCTMPLLLSDGKTSPPHFVYLANLPSSSYGDQKSEQWVQELCQTIFSFADHTLGFYLSPDVLGQENAHKLLLKTLFSLSQSQKFHKIYLLIGSYGLNPLLNTALKLKDIALKKEINLTVYH